MRPCRNPKSGFTLIEMLVGTVLSSIVLLGIFNFVTNMAVTEVRSQRSSTTIAWAQAGINAMSTDIANAGAIGYPPSGLGGSDTLIVCSNWSMKTTPPAKVVAGVQSDAYYYCWDTTDGAPYGNSILRMVANNVGACPTAPPGCTSGVYGANSVVATGIYRNAGNPIFVQDPKTMNAVRLRYSVGNPTANSVSAGGNGGTVTSSPITIPYDTEIILED